MSIDFHLYNLRFHPFITAFGMSPFGIWVEMNFMDLRHEMRETASWEIKTQKAGEEKCAPSSPCLVCGSCKRIAQNLSYLSFFWSTCCDWLWLRCHSILWKGPTTLHYDECKTQSAWVLTLPWKRALQDDSYYTPQPISEFQVGFPLLRIRINQDKP